MAGDDIVKLEQQQIDRFIALGLGRYDAIKALEAGLDVQAVLALVAAAAAGGETAAPFPAQAA